MDALAVRICGEAAGEYWCDPPWTTVRLSDQAARLLGLDDLKTFEVARANAAQACCAEIRFDRAVAETLRTGEPLVMTNTHPRLSDGTLRTLVTVTDVVRDGARHPIQLHGHVVDVTDDVCQGHDLAAQQLVGIVPCGPALVVLLCGEFDLSCRDQLVTAMETISRHRFGTVHLDARHLRFCDAHSLMILTDTAEELGRKQCSVVLHPSMFLRRLLPLVTPGGRQPPFVVRMIPERA